MYHDEGSGGFTDTGNVIDGPWDAWAAVRAFGWKCPGPSGQEVDCAISVTKNWVRSNGTSTCSVRSATCHKVDPGFSIAGNINIEPGAPLPPAAAAVIAAAGPRYAVAGPPAAAAGPTADPHACNISGSWCWDGVADMSFAEPAGERGAFTIENPTGTAWKIAHGTLRSDGTLRIDYGCGIGPPCQVNGSVNTACDLITVAATPRVAGYGTFSRHCPPSPPPAPPAPPQPLLPLPRSFMGDAAWLGKAAIFIQGSSRLADVGGTGRALLSPNMQPGGYGGQFTRDYTYGLVNAPWAGNPEAASVWNLTLDNLIWATEQTMLAQRGSDGQLPDVITMGTSGFNRCSDQYCTFPAGSPLPRPECCGGPVCGSRSLSRYRCLPD